MSDLVKELLSRSSDQDGIGWTPTTVVHVPAGLLHRAADRIAQLDGELSDALTDLNTARQDNVSCTVHVHNQADRIAQLEAALRSIEQNSLSVCAITIARAALEDRPPDPITEQKARGPMTDITIPAAVVEAVAVAEWDAERARIGDYTLPLFEELHPVVKKLKLENAHVACLAMLAAWPGMTTEFRRDSYMGWDGNLIILPQPQENPND